MIKFAFRKFSTLQKKQNLVILGTGWGGFKVMKGIDDSKYDITVISPRNHFVFTPLLASTAVGTLEFRCIAEPIRGINKDIKYHEAAATGIDIENKVVQCENAIDKSRKFSLPYDKLLIACGAIPNTYNTPGVQEHAYFLKEVNDARKIRHHILDRFELASGPTVDEETKKALLNFAVVGGGPTGIELSAEIHDLIKDDIFRIYPKLKPYFKLTVYDVADKILGGFDARLGNYAMKKFKRNGIDIRTGTKIKELKEDRLILADDTEIKVGMVVWATGLGPNPFIKSLPFAKDKSQRLLTNGFLQVLKENHEAIPDVYSLGDCAVIEHYNLPQTAQVAQQKGKYLAKVLNELPKSPHPFTYHHKGAMAYVGDWKALVDTPTFIKESGFLAWVFWRSSYLTMIVSWKNKILIPTYWFLTWAFGRDTSRL